MALGAFEYITLRSARIVLYYGSPIRELTALVNDLWCRI